MWMSFRGPSSSARRNTSSITSSPGGSSVQQPKNQRHDDTDDEARHDREIEAEVSPLDHDVARQPTEPEVAEPRRQQPDDNEHETNRDQPPTDHPAPPFPASKRPTFSLRYGKTQGETLHSDGSHFRKSFLISCL